MTSIESASKQLNGMFIVFSGFRDKDLEDKIKQHGGKISCSVYKTTSLLVMLDVTDRHSKAFKVEELKIPIMSKDQFIDTYFKPFGSLSKRAR